jgi:hypothetical protein
MPPTPLSRIETLPAWSEPFLQSLCGPLAAKGRPSMFQANTDLLIDYWQARRGAEAAPARAAIDPADFPMLLPQVFILGRKPSGHYLFRLVGGLVDELHGGGLNGRDPLSLWAPAYRASLRLALEAIRRQPEPLVVTAEGRSRKGKAAGLEVMFAPLTGASGETDRIFGLYQPTTPLVTLQREVLDQLTIRAVTTVRGANGEFPRLRLAAVNGRQIA